MIKTLIDSIFFSISTSLTAVVPILYSLFDYLASAEILTNNEMEQIWKNLYVILSVLILFAISIKLINSIVNPDVLTDKKKGAKKTFISAIISVLLVVIMPIMFNTLHEIQKKVLTENIIQKYVFGDENASRGGEKLAWVAISSCINLNTIDALSPGDMGLVEKNGIWEPENPEPGSAYAFMLQLGAMRIGVNLANAASSTLTNGRISTNLDLNSIVEFHPFILLIFLIVISYELIILLLDTALRAFKLVLLEMMTPIILGAYVFKQDILKNWILEYIKTFLQIFLLIVALSFMEYIIPVATSISESSNDFLFRGIIRMLLYIGVLRLVKQIIPIVNKIFGTNIQGKGGIKGRLGEMAVVGGLAQKAWGAIGTGVKNIGKLGLQAPLAAGYMAADRQYRKNNGGAPLRESETFRRGKGLLQGVNTALKTGSLLKAQDAYDKGSAAPTLTQDDLSRISTRTNEGLQRAGFNSLGVYDNLKDVTDPVTGEKKKDFKTNEDHKNDKNIVISQATNSLSRHNNGAELVDTMKLRSETESKLNVLNGTSSTRNKVLDQLNSMTSTLEMSGDHQNAIILDNIAKAFDETGLISEDAANTIKNISGLSSGSKKLLSTTYGKLERGRIYAVNEYGLNMSDLTGAVALGNAISATETEVTNLKAQEKKIVDSKDTSPALKVQYEEYDKALSSIASTTSGAAQNDKSIIEGVALWSQNPTDYAGVATSSSTNNSNSNNNNSSNNSNNNQSGSTNNTTIINNATNNINSNTSSELPPANRVDVNVENHYNSTQTSQDIRDTQEREYTQRIRDLQKKSQLTNEEMEELQRITRNLQKIAADNWKENESTRDE